MKKFGPKSGAPARPARARGAPPATGERPPRRSFARAEPGAAPARKPWQRTEGAAPARKPYRQADGEAPARRPYRKAEGDAPPRDFGDPYQRAERPPRARPPRGDAEAGEGSSLRRPAARGFTVTLDPDVARVFRGDASVNKALRLVMQLMQVVQGPARPERAAPPARRGYQGSDEARGFARKPRFVEDEEE